MEQSVKEILLKKTTIMKTKRNWLIIAIAVIMAGGLTGCLEDGQNAYDFQQVPSYMTMKDGKYYMETIGLSVYADLSQATTQPIEILDTYGLSWYNVNYDKQPAGTDGIKVPYTGVVSTGGWYSVKNDRMQPSYDGSFTNYTDTIIDAGLYASQLLRNHAFFVMGEEAPAGRSYNYHLTFNADSTVSQNNVPALYLQTEVTTEGTGAKQLYAYFYAFDMGDLFNNSDYYEEVQIQGVDCERVKFNLYYQKGVDKVTGKPIFKANEDNPMLVYRIKSK